MPRKAAKLLMGIHLIMTRTKVRVRRLPVQFGDRLAQRGVRHGHQPLKGPIELQDQKGCTGDGKRTGKDDRINSSMVRCEQSDAGEDDDKPEHQRHQERRRYGTIMLVD